MLRQLDPDLSVSGCGGETRENQQKNITLSLLHDSLWTLSGKIMADLYQLNSVHGCKNILHILG